MTQFIAVGVGGFIGACARFNLTKLLTEYTAFHFGTLLSNVIAGLLIGLVIGMERQTTELPPTVKLFITTGFLGGLSTFSAFSLETVSLLENGSFLKAGANTLLNIILSFTAVFTGFLIVKMAKRLI